MQKQFRLSSATNQFEAGQETQIGTGLGIISGCEAARDFKVSL